MLGTLYQTEKVTDFVEYVGQIQGAWGTNGTDYPGFGEFISTGLKSYAVKMPGESPVEVITGVKRLELLGMSEWAGAVEGLADSLSFEWGGVLDNYGGAFASFKVADFNVSVAGGDPHTLYVTLRNRWSRSAQTVDAIFHGFRLWCTNQWRLFSTMPRVSLRGYDKTAQLQLVQQIAASAPKVVREQQRLMSAMSQLQVPNSTVAQVIFETFEKRRPNMDILEDLAASFAQGRATVNFFQAAVDAKVQAAANLIGQKAQNYANELSLDSDEGAVNAYALFQALTDAQTHGITRTDVTDQRKAGIVTVKGTPEQKKLRTAIADSNHELVDNFFAAIQTEVMALVE